MNLPSFFIDDSESLKYEETIDFFMSWTIRCADEKYRNGNKKVYENSRKIVSKLIGEEYSDKHQFSNIKVWKQHQNIDLWVEFDFNSQEYALIIEDKMYSDVRYNKFGDNQLSRYKGKVKDHYLNSPSRIDKYVLLRPDYESEKKDEQFIEASGFMYLNLEQLADVLDSAKTGNELFDEFWFNWMRDSMAKREK